MKHGLASTLRALCAGVIVSLFSGIPAQASNEEYSMWDGSVTSLTAQGTPADTFLIGSASDLAWVAQEIYTNGNDFAGKVLVLNAHIDLSGARVWTPIGTQTHPFAGTFDGRGHLIRGLGVLRGSDGVGLFGHIGAGAIVRNTGISGGAILANGKRCVGTLAGVCAGTISNCWSQAQVVTAGNIVGGLVGELTGTMTDVYSAGLLQGGDTIGGLVGYNNGGTITNAYSTGYAQNGRGFVGVDNGGHYADCYYDRKLYYQEPGIVTDGLTPMDVTSDMFSLFTGNALWTQTEDCYPQLTSFAATDASLLSVAPMYINTIQTEPVNHASDLTEDFTVMTDGGIAWTCHEEEGKRWIQISGANVTVIRPCTEVNVLVDAKLGSEVHTVSLHPRRIEDLMPGKFIGVDRNGAGEVIHEGVFHHFCWDESNPWPLRDSADMSAATRGWTRGEYHYMVVRDAIDDSTNDTTRLEVILPDATWDEYKNWFDNYQIRTNYSGHYLIRSFVHDEGCIQDWIENAPGFEYLVFNKFVPGEIDPLPLSVNGLGIDTFLLDNPIHISVASKSASTGGTGTIWYQWYVKKDNGNDEEIEGATGLTLTDYTVITSKGEYRFTRATGDDKCYTTPDDREAWGVYIARVFDPLNPGSVTDAGLQAFCSVADAQGFTVRASGASGAVSDRGYAYQWYMNGAAITGATSKDLALNDAALTGSFALQPGQDYTFTRMAKDNTRFTVWTLSSGEQKIHIRPVLNTGAIGNDDLGQQCVAPDVTTLVVTVSETAAASGEGTLQYRWLCILGTDSTEIGTAPSLNYTLDLKNENIGRTYKFIRQVQQADCGWVESAGATTLSFGKKSYSEKTVNVCEGKMPYTMVRYDSNGANPDVHVFTADGEQWLYTDNAAGGCPSDTLFTINVIDIPTIAIESEARLCQEHGDITLYFDQLSGVADHFLITYSPDLAKFIGVNDTTGVISVPGTIVLRNVPSIGEGNCYMNVQVGNAGAGLAAEGVCYSQAYTVRFYPSLGGYVHSKYGRVLFVDNNPDNGELPAPKLHFTAYQWYRNGVLQPNQTGQYYHENGTALNGIYYVLLTDENGVVYRTCDVTMPEEDSTSAAPAGRIYPVPAEAGGQLTVLCDEQSYISIISMNGERVSTTRTVFGETTIQAPRMAGLYYVQIEHADGTVTTDKLIVK